MQVMKKSDVPIFRQNEKKKKIDQNPVNWIAITFLTMLGLIRDFTQTTTATATGT